jgi:hypothetical protein
MFSKLSLRVLTAGNGERLLGEAAVPTAPMSAYRMDFISKKADYPVRGK